MSAARSISARARAAIPHPSFVEALHVWLRIGVLSFGGPAGQIALMHRVLVEEKRWISDSRFLHALNYCMLLPGPEAQQLATYVGWLMHRTLGGLVAGTLFVLPGAIVILILSVLYAGFRELTVVDALFFGIKCAVLAVVVEAVLRIGKRALKNWMLALLAATAFVAIFFFAVPFPIIVAAAAAAGFIGGKLRPDLFAPPGHGPAGHRQAEQAEAISEADLEHTRPSLKRALLVTVVCGLLWFVPIVLLWQMLGREHVFVQESLVFSKMAVVTFGGAYAVLAYVAQQAVESFGWLAPGEMLDGLGLAETTPGPLILVLQFVGFMGAFRSPGALDPMMAGVIGSLLTTWVTFVPCFLWIFLGAPYIEALRGNRALGSALSGITAAVVGVVLNLALWFGLHVVFGKVNEVWHGPLRLYTPELASIDWVAFVLAATALLAMLRFKVGMLPTLGVAAVAGLIWRMAFGG
ncbi:MAG: chromate efflux transporter [Pseudomonadota bacterium]|nr:chromate efflux transporter [Pseudomonadota bacterium]